MSPRTVGGATRVGSSNSTTLSHTAGGLPTVENIQLRCRAHNGYEVTRFLGPGKRWTRADIVREGRRVYGAGERGENSSWDDLSSTTATIGRSQSSRAAVVDFDRRIITLRRAMTADLADREWTVRAPGGPLLFGQSWGPATAPRAAVLVVHGLAEHTGRYGLTAAALNDAGFAVHAVDYRGHGRSEGRRVHVDDVGDYVADVRAALEEVRRRNPGLPVFLLGHSQGGLIALKAALDDPAVIDGLVVTSPFLAVHPTRRPWPSSARWPG